MIIKPGDIIKAADIGEKEIIEYTVKSIKQIGDEVKVEVSLADGYVTSMTRGLFSALIKKGNEIANTVELDATEV